MSRTLLEQWKDIAYDESADRATLQRFWGTYFQTEKEIYEQLLSNPDEEVKGTVKELAEKYGQEVLTMVGFLDGIDESLKEPNPIETMDENTVVSLAFDKEKLYKNMVAAKADWLYGLPQWKEIYSEEELKKLYKEQKESTTIRKAVSYTHLLSITAPSVAFLGIYKHIILNIYLKVNKNFLTSNSNGVIIVLDRAIKYARVNHTFE